MTQSTAIKSSNFINFFRNRKYIVSKITLFAQLTLINVLIRFISAFLSFFVLFCHFYHVWFYNYYIIPIQANDKWIKTGQSKKRAITIIFFSPQRQYIKNSLNSTLKSKQQTRESYIECRSSQRRCSVKKGALRNFSKFIGKHLCQSLFWASEPTTLLKKRLWHRCFPVYFAKFLTLSCRKSLSYRN